MPTSADVLCLFIEFLLRSLRSPKSVANAVASVRHLHLELGAPLDVFGSYDVRRALRALPLTVRHIPQPAAPMTASVLRRIVSFCLPFGQRGKTFTALCLVAFYSLARLSSLLPTGPGFDASRLPTFRDLTSARPGFSLHIKFAKNAQAAAQGFSVPLLPAADPLLCPVRALNSMRSAWALPGPGSPLFLWSQDGAVSRGTRLLPLTMPVARAFLRRVLTGLGLPPTAFTFHSFRRGGCTAAAQGGAAVSDLQALGHWQSDAVRAYFSPLPSQLRAARALLDSTQAAPADE